MSKKQQPFVYPEDVLSNEEMALRKQLRKIIQHELMMQTTMLLQQFSTVSWLKLNDMLLVLRDIETFPKASMPKYKDALLALVEMQEKELERMKKNYVGSTNAGEDFENALQAFSEGSDPVTSSEPNDPLPPATAEELQDLFATLFKKGGNKEN